MDKELKWKGRAKAWETLTTMNASGGGEKSSELEDPSAFEDPDATEEYRSAKEAPAFKASFALEDPSAFEDILEETSAFEGHVMLKDPSAFEESPALKGISTFEEAPALEEPSALEEPTTADELIARVYNTMKEKTVPDRTQPKLTADELIASVYTEMRQTKASDRTKPKTTEASASSKASVKVSSLSMVPRLAAPAGTVALKTGRASLTKAERKRLNQLQPAKDLFLGKFGYYGLMKYFPDVPFEWRPKNIHEANARLEWIDDQPHVIAFKTSKQNEALILECEEDEDSRMSPMTRYAQLYCAHETTYRNALPVYYWAHGMRTYSPYQAITWMSGEILLEGFDPYVAVPDKRPPDRPIPAGVLANFIESHRRRAPVIVVLDSLGVYDDVLDVATDWSMIVHRLIDMVKSNRPDLKPFKLLIVNPLESWIIDKIRKSRPEIPMVTCPDVEEFRELVHKDSIPAQQ